MELSQKLKYLRKKKGVSQLELAERLSVSRQAVSGWEAGTSRPSTENLQSLSRLFNIPLETLLNDTLEVESVAIPEKSPVEEQVKEENKEQKPRKVRSRRILALVIVLLLVFLLVVGILAYRGVFRKSSDVITFGEMEHEIIDAAGAEYKTLEGFDEMG